MQRLLNIYFAAFLHTFVYVYRDLIPLKRINTSPSRNINFLHLITYRKTNFYVGWISQGAYFIPYP